MHILGGGSEADVKHIEKAVGKANAQSNGCQVTYEGAKWGREFEEYIQSCHIGLSSQNVDASFNVSSFPSKVFMYLSNGLDVVSVDLPVFENSLRDALTLCVDNRPESLADAIIDAANRRTRPPIHLLDDLDGRLKLDLKHLIAMLG